MINEILINFSNILFNQNKLNLDIALLINAYNIVGGATSSFLRNIIKLNNNLNFLWDYRFTYRKNFNYQKFDNKYELYNNNNIKIFTMYSDINYFNIMKTWKNTMIQREVMVKQNCNNNFIFNIENKI